MCFFSPRQNSGETEISRISALMLPSFCRNTLASRSTRVAGGSSETKYVASFREMCLAVEGCSANIPNTCCPSSILPPAGNFCPRIIFSLTSWFQGTNWKSPSCIMLLGFPFLRLLFRFTFQPVNARATSTTSFWVYPPSTPSV